MYFALVGAIIYYGLVVWEKLKISNLLEKDNKNYAFKKSPVSK